MEICVWGVSGYHLWPYQDILLVIGVLWNWDIPECPVCFCLSDFVRNSPELVVNRFTLPAVEL